MNLTPENKAHIDARTYAGLLFHWRFCAVGDPWLSGETGKYWAQRMGEMKAGDPEMAELVSANIGFKKFWSAESYG